MSIVTPGRDAAKQSAPYEVDDELRDHLAENGRVPFGEAHETAQVLLTAAATDGCFHCQPCPRAECKRPLNGREWRAFQAVLQLTVLFSKLEDEVTHDQIGERSGMSKPTDRRNLVRAVKEVAARNLIVYDAGGAMGRGFPSWVKLPTERTPVESDHPSQGDETPVEPDHPSAGSVLTPVDPDTEPRSILDGNPGRSEQETPVEPDLPPRGIQAFPKVIQGASDFSSDESQEQPSSTTRDRAEPSLLDVSSNGSEEDQEAGRTLQIPDWLKRHPDWVEILDEANRRRPHDRWMMVLWEARQLMNGWTSRGGLASENGKDPPIQSPLVAVVRDPEPADELRRWA